MTDDITEVVEEASDTVLTFNLDDDTFGLPVGNVVEIIDPLPVTPVPNGSPFAPGLVNIRGVVAPIIDLRGSLNLPDREMGSDSRMLVIDVPVDGEPTTAVVVADSVEAIIDVPPERTDPVPDLGTRWPKTHVTGLLKRDSDLVVLLDVERVFTADADAPPS